MCLIPGLADGRYLIADGVIDESQAVEAWCACGQGHHGHGHPQAGVTRRGALGRAAASAAGLAFAALAG
ncbi:MAG TPA: hypothetical protein VNT03_10710, partial [Baekduia sp.]|nr:hypothetical protein [Baekduia sp.]